MNKKLNEEDKKFIRARYSGKVWELGYYLLADNIRGETFEYIMQDGEKVVNKPNKARYLWMKQAMIRLAEKLPSDKLKAFREGCACCLGGERDQLAKAIKAKYQTVDERFNALIQEPKLFYGKCYKEGNAYFISFYFNKPIDGYKCSCLKYTPKKAEGPMEKTWCLCCGGHVLHHFETALGVKANCEFISSALNSCGEEPCLFKLTIIDEKNNNI